MLGRSQSPGDGLIPVRQTLVATGGAPLPFASATDIFTITGRVLVERFTVFCTETLVGGTNISVGVAGTTDLLVAATTSTDIDVNEWWATTSPALNGLAMDAKQKQVLLSNDIILTITVSDVTDGTLVFDAWYRPITDNGILVAS